MNQSQPKVKNEYIRQEGVKRILKLKNEGVVFVENDEFIFENYRSLKTKVKVICDSCKCIKEMNAKSLLESTCKTLCAPCARKERKKRSIIAYAPRVKGNASAKKKARREKEAAITPIFLKLAASKWDGSLNLEGVVPLE